MLHLSLPLGRPSPSSQSGLIVEVPKGNMIIPKTFAPLNLDPVPPSSAAAGPHAVQRHIQYVGIGGMDPALVHSKLLVMGCNKICLNVGICDTASAWNAAKG